MKVVIVQSRVCFGGAEHVGVMLANALAEKHEVWLATNTRLEMTYAVSDKVKVCNIFPDIPHGLKKWVGAISRLRELFEKEQPDVNRHLVNLFFRVQGCGNGTWHTCDSYRA